MKKGTIRSSLKSIGKSKYRLRILVCLFIVAVLAIGIVDVVVFREVAFWVEEDSKREEESVLENLANIYENHVLGYQEQAQLLSLNRYIKAYLLSGGKENVHEESIYLSMKALTTNRPEISSVILFYKDEILASYDTRAVSMEAKEETVKKITESKTDKEFFYVWPSNTAYTKQMVVFRSDREYLYGPSVYGVALVIRMDYVQDQVLPENRDAESLLYILHESGEPVAMQKNDYKEEIPRIYQRIQEEEALLGTWYEDIDETEKKISYVQSGQFITIKIQKIPRSQVQITRAQQIILLSTVLAMGVIAAMAWFLSGWMYRPLGKIFENIQTIARLEEADDKNEITFALNGLTDIEQNIGILKSRLMDNSVIQFLRYGREGDMVNRDMFGFRSYESDVFTMIVLRYHMENEAENDQLLIYLAENLRTIQEAQLRSARCYRASQNEIVILVCENMNEEKNTDIRGAARRLLEELEHLYHINGCIGITRCTRPDKLPHAYRKAVLLTGYYILSNQIRIMDEELLKEKSTAAVNEPEKEDILAYVRGDKEIVLAECVDRLLNNLTIYHIKAANNYLNDLITDVFRIAESVLDEKYEQYEMYLDNLLTNGIFISQIDVREWLCQLFLQVKAQVQAGYKSATVQTMEHALGYIEEHYHDSGISIEAVAGIYGLSVSYFSKLFNRYTGKSFPDYICQIRLKNACRLLTECPNLSISEVSRRVGFNSSSYFAATYRKYYGVSPSQTRRCTEKLTGNKKDKIDNKK